MTIDRKMEFIEVWLALMELEVDALTLRVNDKVGQGAQDHDRLVIGVSLLEREPMDMDVEETKRIQGDHALDDESVGQTPPL